MKTLRENWLMCEVQRLRTSLLVQYWGYEFDSSSGKITAAAGQLEGSATFMPAPCSQFLPILLPTVDEGLVEEVGFPCDHGTRCTAHGVALGVEGWGVQGASWESSCPQCPGSSVCSLLMCPLVISSWLHRGCPNNLHMFNVHEKYDWIWNSFSL